jgi:Flp pilus assembly protein TadD
VWTRYLRRLVERLGGCLSAVSPRARRILVWRTGFGGGHASSQRQVASRLGVGIVRERRLEREAATELRTTAPASGCSGPAASPDAAPAPADDTAMAGEVAGPPVAVTGGQSQPGSVGATSLPGRSPASPGSRPSPRAARSRARVQQSGFATPPPPGGLGDSALLLVVLALVAVAVVLTPRSRWLTPLLASSAPPAVAAASVPAAQPADGDERDSAVATPEDQAPADPFELGFERYQQGDLAGAIVAFRAAEERGDPAAASNLGVLLEQQGDLAGAQAAYRRADERGDTNGAFNLGSLLAQRGQLAGAVAAFRRAYERGDPAALHNVGTLLQQQGDLAGAEAAFRRSTASDDPEAAAQARSALNQLREQTRS